MIRQLGCSLLLATTLAAPALAQTDSIAMAHTAAANQLGILEYCQAKGNVGGDAVDAQKEAIARMPASAVATGPAEALGKGGTLAAPNGQQMTLDSVASAHNTTVASMCAQLGSAAVQAAAMYKQSGMPGGMPTMGSMPTMPGAMPAVPGGMPAMPSMPGMPTAPAR